MSRGYSQRGTDGIMRHYDSRGNMTGYSQRGNHKLISWNFIPLIRDSIESNTILLGSILIRAL